MLSYYINTVTGSDFHLRSVYMPYLTSNASSPLRSCPSCVPVFDSDFSSVAFVLSPPFVSTLSL